MKKLNLQYNYANDYEEEEEEETDSSNQSDEAQGVADHSPNQSGESLSPNLNESELIELIRRQIKQKNFKLESFVDNYDELSDVFGEESESTAAHMDFSKKYLSGQIKAVDEADEDVAERYAFSNANLLICIIFEIL